MSRKTSILNIIKEYTLTIVLIVTLIGTSFFNFFQSYMDLSESEEVALVILLITAILWISEIIPLFVTSLGVLLLSLMWLLPIMQGSGLEVTKEVFFLSFFSDITLLFMGGFVLSILLDKYRLAQRMANHILVKMGNNPSKVLWSIILVSSLLSMWMSNTATAAMMLAIVGPIILQLPDNTPFAKALAISIPFACNLGGLGTPIGTPPNAIALQYLHQVGLSISFVQWMIFVVPIMLILLYILWKLLLKIYPPVNINFEFDETKPPPLNRVQYIVIGLFALTILGWMTTGWTGLTTGTVGLIVVLISFGTNLLQIRDFRNLSWDILFMLGGGLCLGAALNTSGLTTTFAGYIGLDEGFWIIFVILMMIGALMTTFMSNTATANLLIPIAVSLQQNEILVAISIAVVCSTSMAMPVSTPPNAIAFGSGLLKSKDMIKSGLIITLIAIFAIILFGYFYFPLFL